MIIDGKKISNEIKEELRIEIEKLISGGRRRPGLAVVQVGDDKASNVYVNSKVRTCENLGIYGEKHLLPSTTSEKELLNLIDNLNKDEKIDGILVQLPLPNGIEKDRVIERISIDKDVDGFKSESLGNLLLGFEDGFVSCTPLGIMELLKRYEIDLSGMDVVVVGRSDIVGKPLIPLLLNKDATVTVCHSRTKNLKEKTLGADLVIVAVGRENLLTEDMVKKGAVVVDVGINRREDKTLCGDVDFSGVSKVASHITPVPGGVGPMTIAMLMRNTLKSYKKTHKI